MGGWAQFEKYSLTVPQRQTDLEFCRMLDSIGEGTMEVSCQCDGSPMVQLSNIKTYTDDDAALKWVLPHTGAAATRAILTASNARVDELNTKIQEQNPRQLVDLQGASYLKTTHLPMEKLQELSIISEELLADANEKHVPPHVLRLKEGDICFLLATVSKKDLLVKNQRVRILKIHKRVINIEILLGNGQVHKHMHTFPCASVIIFCR